MSFKELKKPDPIVRQVKKQELEHQHIGNLVLHRGKKLYVWQNYKVREVDASDYMEEEEYDMTSKKPSVKKLKIVKGCFYRQAYHFNHAVKVFRRIGLTVVLRESVDD